MSSCRVGLYGKRLKTVLHWTQSFPDSSPFIIDQIWSHHWILCCLCKNVFMKEWKFLKEEEGTWRQWRNRDRQREPEGNSKRIPRSERLELFYGRAYIPKGTEPVEGPCQSRGKKQRRSIKRNHYILNCKHCHPSITGLLPHWKYWMKPVAIISWEVRGAQCEVWEKEWCLFLKCSNDFFVIVLLLFLNIWKSN